MILLDSHTSLLPPKQSNEAPTQACHIWHWYLACLFFLNVHIVKTLYTHAPYNVEGDTDTMCGKAIAPVPYIICLNFS